MEIFSPNNFVITVDDLISIFNKCMKPQYDEFLNDMERFIENPKENYCPSPSFQNWLVISKSLVNDETEKEFKNKLEEVGWTIEDFFWQKDERTGDDILYIYIKK